MKKTILLVVLLGAMVYSQNKIIRQNDLNDYYDSTYVNAPPSAAVSQLISDSLVRFDDSLRVHWAEIIKKIDSLVASGLINDSLLVHLLNMTEDPGVPFYSHGVWVPTSVSAFLDSTGLTSSLNALDGRITSNAEDIHDRYTSNTIDYMFALRDAEIAQLQTIIDSLGVRLNQLTPSYPATPTSLVATGTTTDIGLTWTSADSIAIYSCTDGVNYAFLDTVTSGVGSYTHTGMLPNQTYYYYIKAISPDGVYSAPSNIDTSYMLPTTTDTYYASATATGGGVGSFADPFTIYEAVATAGAGDTVIVKRGKYDISSELICSNSGTASEGIWFIGEIIAGYDYHTVNQDSMTYFELDNYAFNSRPSILISGQYVHFQNIAFVQDNTCMSFLVTGRGSGIDNCVHRYPSNTLSSTVHTYRISGNADSSYITNSQFINGTRTIVWVEGGLTSSNTPDSVQITGDTFEGSSNHYAIQVMPYTTYDPSSTDPIEGLNIQKNLFKDNSYSESCVLLRHCVDFKFINNIMDNSGGLWEMITPLPASGDRDTCNAQGSLIVFNTVIDTTHSYFGMRNVSGGNGVTVKNNIVMLKHGYNSLADYLYDFRANAPAPASILRHDFDYNMYDISSRDLTTSTPVLWGSNTYTIAAFKTATGLETNSTFNTRVSVDNFYTPTSAIEGETISGVSEDYYGNPRATPPTVGAVEP